jgi:hypothetical protein
MKILTLLLLILLSSFITFGQSVINVRLKNQLDSTILLDQKYREILSNGILEIPYEEIQLPNR